MTLVGFKTILHKKCRSGKNSEGPVENSWVLDISTGRGLKIGRQSPSRINQKVETMHQKKSSQIQLGIPSNFEKFTRFKT
jgi:hypothetical protein